jgi:outer membrane lipoprotein
MKLYLTALTLVPMLLFIGACSQQDIIPEHLEGRVDQDLRFTEVKENPDAYQGKLVLAGGQVLSADRLKEGTKIEVLQYPLTNQLVPERRRESSKGRFIAMDMANHVSDPAVLADNSLVTLVGKVDGTTTVKIGEVEEQVPKLKIEHITVWDHDSLQPYYGYQAPYAWGYGAYYGRTLYW